MRFGVYLRPSYEMGRAQAEIHGLLRRQFGLIAAGAFMPHARIRGFLRTDATIGDIVRAVEGALAGRPPFTIVNNGPVLFDRGGVSLDVQHLDLRLAMVEMLALHEAVFTTLVPLIHTGL